MVYTRMSLRQLYTDLAEKYSDNVSPTLSFITFTDKGSAHTYIEFYEKYFDTKKDQHVDLLEIGLMSGGSLYLWKNYFTDYTIVGIDLAPTWFKQRPFQSELENDENIKLVFEVDSRRSAIPEEVFTRQFDYIIDDGNHNVKPQIATMKNYWQFVKSGGTYFIEDVLGERHARLLIKELENFSKEKFTYEVYRGNINRPDDRIVAITKQ